MPGDPGIGSTSASRQRLRRLWLKVHRWLGLSLGAVLMVAAMSGSAMLLAEPLDESLNRALFHVPDASTIDYRAVVDSLKDDLGPDADITLRPPRAEQESFQAHVRGSWKGTVFLHPTSGEILGRRGEAEGMMSVLFALHSNLFAGDAGKAVLTLAAFAYLLMLASGVYLWWPTRWRNALSIRWSAGGRLALFDWHRVTGVVFGVLILLAVLSGAYMAWPPLAGTVNALSDSPPVSPPVVPGGPPRPEIVEQAVARASAVFPEAATGYVQIPARPSFPIRVRLRLPDDPHPNGLTSVWLHPDSAELVRVDRWSELSPGTWAYSYIYPFHTGELWGPVWTVLTFLAGATLSAYSITGLLLWWRRRR